jgi:hypothetical protein
VPHYLKKGRRRKEEGVVSLWKGKRKSGARKKQRERGNERGFARVG